MSPSSTATLEFELTRADLDAFVTHDAAHSPHLARRIRRMRLVWAVVFAVIAIEYGRTSPVGALGFAAVGIAYLALYGPLNRFLYVRQRRGLRGRPETPGVGPVRLALASGRLEVQAARGSAHLDPADIRRIDESASHYFLYVGPSSAIVVPRLGATRGDPDALVRSLRATLRPRRSTLAPRDDLP
jgi:hypothetical protein